MDTLLGNFTASVLHYVLLHVVKSVACLLLGIYNEFLQSDYTLYLYFELLLGAVFYQMCKRRRHSVLLVLNEGKPIKNHEIWCKILLNVLKCRGNRLRWKPNILIPICKETDEFNMRWVKLPSCVSSKPRISRSSRISYTEDRKTVNFHKHGKGKNWKTLLRISRCQKFFSSFEMIYNICV